MQFDFLIDALKTRVASRCELAEEPEFAALLGGDSAAMAELGLPADRVRPHRVVRRTVTAEFTALFATFIARATHATLGRPLTTIVYQPMLELLDELRRREFTVAIVTGGGTEFVRAISDDLYRRAAGARGRNADQVRVQPRQRRPTQAAEDRSIVGDANEGATKVTNIQTQLGRRPILGGGNSGGDREMLEWACAGDRPRLAILIDHDDEEREFQYVGTAQTFAETEADHRRRRPPRLDRREHDERLGDRVPSPVAAGITRSAT